jgi:uncharacterized membrane protein YfcA
MSTSAAALFYLRRKQQKDAVRGKWTKLTPFLTVIFVLSYFGIAVAVVISKPLAAVTGMCLLLLLAAIYFIFYYKKKQ